MVSHSRSRRWPFPVAVLLLLPALAAATQAAPGSPEEVVAAFHQGVAEHAGRAPDEDAHAHFIERLEATHDMPRIARMVLGRHWEALDGEQREAFIETFTGLSAATWLGRFSGAEGVAFEIEGGRIEGERARVDARILSPGGQRTPLTYQLRHDAGDWRIINVLAEGVSDLALRRTQYDRLIREHGFEALLEAVQAEIHAELGQP